MGEQIKPEEHAILGSLNHSEWWEIIGDNGSTFRSHSSETQ